MSSSIIPGLTIYIRCAYLVCVIEIRTIKRWLIKRCRVAVPTRAFAVLFHPIRVRVGPTVAIMCPLYALVFGLPSICAARF